MRNRGKIGYIIVNGNGALRHVDNKPYWLQLSSFAEVYSSYRLARRDYNRQISAYRAALREAFEQGTKRRILLWIDTLTIIPIYSKHASKLSS